MQTTFTTNDRLTLSYWREGQAGQPVLLFSNPLGTTYDIWDEQVLALKRQFQIIRYDTRGHGVAGVPATPATIERLGQDLLAILDHAGVEQATICGLSLGGLTAQWLAIQHPERVRSLVLANTAARIGSDEVWSNRIKLVSAGGMQSITELVLARLFSAEFRLANPAIVEQLTTMISGLDPVGYNACCAALRDADLRPLVSQIKAPTLVIGGIYDSVTTIEQAEALHHAIEGSLLGIIQAAHLSIIESPTVFSRLLLEFLS